MRLGIMQPYFLPYLGYFSLIAATDRFVIFDPVQYIRHGWINRNRVLKPDFEQPQYIQIPLVKHARQTLIRDIKISGRSDCKARIMRQIQHYKRRAPYFEQARSILQECLELETESLVALNVHCLVTVCRALDLEFKPTRFDELPQTIQPVLQAGEWAVHMSAALGASVYINPIGGRDIFQPQQFTDRGIELQFLENSLAEYPQKNRQFVAGLSILDVLMFNSVAETRRQIDSFTICAA